MAKLVRGIIAAMAAIAIIGCRVQHASDNHAKQQVMYSLDARRSAYLQPRDRERSSIHATVINDIFEGLIRINEVTACTGARSRGELGDRGRSEVDHVPSSPRHQVVGWRAVHLA